MRGMLLPYNSFQSKNLLEKVLGFDNCKKEVNNNEPISVLDTRSPSPSTSTSTLSSLGGNAGGGILPLENGLRGGPEVGGRKDELAVELQQIPVGSYERLGLGLEDWESLLSESAALPGQDQSLLRLISGEAEDGFLSLKDLLQGGNFTEICGVGGAGAGIGVIDQSSGFETSPVKFSGNFVTNLSSSLGVPDIINGNICSAPKFSDLNSNCNAQNPRIGSAPNSSDLNNNCNQQNPNLILPSSGNCQQQKHQFITLDQKPQIFNPQMMMNQQQFHNPNMLSSFSYGTQQERHQFESQPKRHNPGIPNPYSESQVPKVPFFDPGSEFLLRKQPQFPQMLDPKQEFSNQPNLVPPIHQQKQVIHDQLYKAIELILSGNFSHAQAILARLNHQLSPIQKPFQRVAFYFKEALQMPLLLPETMSRIPTPLDAIFKMGAYRALSEVSPLTQFMNFTSNQALLEALEGAKHVHIVDFDIGIGTQWASFMQELPRGNGGVSSLKITAFASPTTHHPIELGLMHEHLTELAQEIGVRFELEVVNFDSFDPNSYSVSPSQSFEDEAVAVNFPIWSSSSHLSALPSLLRFIKQLSPKIVVSLDRWCERTDLPFSQHLLHALQYYEVLLDSIDASNVSSDTVNKIERFIFQPRIESMVLGRLRCPDQTPHWKTLFASAGFSPVAFSTSAEIQAECLAKRTQVKGLHVEKRQASLMLYWLNRELMSASAWRC